MEIITGFLAAIQALMLAKVALFLAAGLGLAAFGLARRKRWLIALGLLLAFGQFAWPWFANRAQDAGISARRAHVQRLATTPIPRDYPRRLIIDGDIVPSPPAWFIALGYADAVEIDGQRLVAASDIKGCREAALAIANPDGEASRRGYEGNPYDRLKLCVTASPASPDGDAVILRAGNRTTLFDRENARRHGAPVAIQLSVRQDGRETLAHYDEMPIVGSPSSATQLLPAGYDYPCPRFAYLQITANFLDAARQPTRAASLLRRGPVRRSKYDDCIASAPPEPAS